MPSLSDQRKARIMEAVEYAKRFGRGYILLFDKVLEFLREKHPTLTQPTIKDYARSAVRILEAGYSHQSRVSR